MGQLLYSFNNIIFFSYIIINTISYFDLSKSLLWYIVICNKFWSIQYFCVMWRRCLYHHEHLLGRNQRAQAAVWRQSNHARWNSAPDSTILGITCVYTRSAGSHYREEEAQSWLQLLDHVQCHLTCHRAAEKTSMEEMGPTGGPYPPGW